MDVWAGIGWMFGILVALFVVRLVVVSVWDAWQLGPRWHARQRRKLEKKPVVVDAIADMAEYKQKERARLHDEWMQGFHDALHEKELATLGQLFEAQLNRSGLSGMYMEISVWKREHAKFVKYAVGEYVRFLTEEGDEEFDVRLARAGVAKASEYTIRSTDGWERNEVMLSYPPVPPRGGSGVSVPRTTPDPAALRRAEEMLF
jgi:hypothetical protein